MLNLPQPGLATGILAKSWGNTIDQKREDEKEKTKMIGNALLQQAQSGTLDEKGFAALDAIDPALGSTARNMNTQAAEQNKAKLLEMKMNKTLLGYKSANTKLELMDKFEKLGDSENAKILADEINQYFKAVGIEANVSPLMKAGVRKAQVAKADLAALNKAIGEAEKNPTELTIKHANDLLMLSTKTIDKSLLSVIEKRIGVVNSRLAKEKEHQDKIADEKDKETRTQKIKMTNPKNGRTVDIPVGQQAAFEKAGWELGGRSELPKEGTETPEQKRQSDLQIKKDFAVWKQGLPDSPEKGLNTNQQRILDQSLATAGSTILNNADSEAVKPHIAYVNKYLSKEQYVFTWATKKGMWSDKGTAVRVDLPNGVSAEDVKYTMKKESKSMNQVLKELGLLE